MEHNAELRIVWEWESGQAVRAPEHQATWARIQIFVDDDCVTWVEDRESGSARRAIYAPMYPLAEWIVYNWWFLRAHARPAETGFRERHGVRAAGDGFVWPNIAIYPDGLRTRVLWNRDVGFEESYPIRYLTSGEATVDSDEILRMLSHVVTSVLERLRDQAVRETPLEKEWEALGALGPDEKQFCMVAAQLGLDAFAETDRYEEAIIEAAERLPRSLLNDFFDAVHIESLSTAAGWVIAAADQANTRAGEADDEIRELRRALGGQRDLRYFLPYQLGWKDARTVRDVLGLHPQDSFDVTKYAYEDHRSGGDPNLQALGAAPGDALPAVVTSRRLGRNGSRFILCRALWRRLAVDDSSFLITTAYTERQKIERAFAAELLAPAAGVKLELDVPPEIAIQEDLDGVAEHYGVSTMLVEHQIENQILRRTYA